MGLFGKKAGKKNSSVSSASPGSVGDEVVGRKVAPREIPRDHVAPPAIQADEIEIFTAQIEDLGRCAQNHELFDVLISDIDRNRLTQMTMILADRGDFPAMAKVMQLTDTLDTLIQQRMVESHQQLRASLNRGQSMAPGKSIEEVIIEVEAALANQGLKADELRDLIRAFELHFFELQKSPYEQVLVLSEKLYALRTRYKRVSTVPLLRSPTRQLETSKSMVLSPQMDVRDEEPTHHVPASSSSLVQPVLRHSLTVPNSEVVAAVVSMGIPVTESSGSPVIDDPWTNSAPANDLPLDWEPFPEAPVSPELPLSEIPAEAPESTAPTSSAIVLVPQSISADTPDSATPASEEEIEMSKAGTFRSVSVSNPSLAEETLNALWDDRESEEGQARMAATPAGVPDEIPAEPEEFHSNMNEPQDLHTGEAVSVASPVAESDAVVVTSEEPTEVTEVAEVAGSLVVSQDTLNQTEAGSDEPIEVAEVADSLVVSRDTLNQTEAVSYEPTEVADVADSLVVSQDTMSRPMVLEIEAVSQPLESPDQAVSRCLNFDIASVGGNEPDSPDSLMVDTFNRSEVIPAGDAGWVSFADLAQESFSEHPSRSLSISQSVEITQIPEPVETYSLQGTVVRRTSVTYLLSPVLKNPLTIPREVVDSFTAKLHKRSLTSIWSKWQTFVQSSIRLQSAAQTLALSRSHQTMRGILVDWNLAASERVLQFTLHVKHITSIFQSWRARVDALQLRRAEAEQIVWRRIVGPIVSAWRERIVSTKNRVFGLQMRASERTLSEFVDRWHTVVVEERQKLQDYVTECARRRFLRAWRDVMISDAMRADKYHTELTLRRSMNQMRDMAGKTQRLEQSSARVQERVATNVLRAVVVEMVKILRVRQLATKFRSHIIASYLSEWRQEVQRTKLVRDRNIPIRKAHEILSKWKKSLPDHHPDEASLGDISAVSLSSSVEYYLIHDPATSPTVTSAKFGQDIKRETQDIITRTQIFLSQTRDRQLVTEPKRFELDAPLQSGGLQPNHVSHSPESSDPFFSSFERKWAIETKKWHL